jgi:hypothetical protein
VLRSGAGEHAAHFADERPAIGARFVNTRHRRTGSSLH